MHYHFSMAHSNNDKKMITCVRLHYHLKEEKMNTKANHFNMNEEQAATQFAYLLLKKRKAKNKKGNKKI